MNHRWVCPADRRFAGAFPGAEVRHRDKWAALFLRVALWMREAPSEFDLCWRELAIVAKALADGRDMSEIGLMRDIAQRTVAVLADDARI
jgi:DNA-binding NarL/FixJ family response regulator